MAAEGRQVTRSVDAPVVRPDAVVVVVLTRQSRRPAPFGTFSTFQMGYTTQAGGQADPQSIACNSDRIHTKGHLSIRDSPATRTRGIGTRVGLSHDHAGQKGPGPSGSRCV